MGHMTAAAANAQHDNAEGRRIAGHGTPDADWQAWAGLFQLPAVAVRELVAPQQRAVIVAPHPDDEVLACGGLLQLLAAQGTRTVLVAATDGDASHPGSSLWTPPQLAHLRSGETAAALNVLFSPAPSAAPTMSAVNAGAPVRVIRARLPDGGVTAHCAELQTLLEQLLRPDDVVFVTWRHDGHPDHEACGHAAATAARACGAALVEMPVWTWHWAAPGDVRVPWQRARRLALPPAVLQRKQQAIACYTSQLLPDPSTGADPILPPHVLARLTHPYEVYFP